MKTRIYGNTLSDVGCEIYPEYHAAAIERLNNTNGNDEIF